MLHLSGRGPWSTEGCQMIKLTGGARIRTRDFHVWTPQPYPLGHRRQGSKTKQRTCDLLKTGEKYSTPDICWSHPVICPIFEPAVGWQIHFLWDVSKARSAKTSFLTPSHKGHVKLLSFSLSFLWEFQFHSLLRRSEQLWFRLLSHSTVCSLEWISETDGRWNSPK